MPDYENDKKKEEQYFVELFLLKAGFQFIIEPSEAPDFRLHHESQINGLEVTRLFHQSSEAGMPRRAGESLREKVVALARGMYESTKDPVVHVSVFFNSSKPFNKPRVASLAHQLKDLVIRNMPSQNSHTEEVYDWANRK